MPPTPGYRRFVKTTGQALKPREWHRIGFDLRDGLAPADPAELVGADEPTGALYDLSVGVTLTNITPDREVRLRAVEFAPDGSGGWRTHRDLPVEVFTLGFGHGGFTYAWKDRLEPGHRVEVWAAQFGEADAHLVAAEAVVFLWPR
ncbi:hypothetical protein [Nocardiopsis prasina]|uniref:hypothetical protein n=1 Tax=Nocardiopsis prasina TaxID=2015 RepID=UPI00034AC21E|nr:hypothetical protein [Nocardiopsis prasina]